MARRVVRRRSEPEEIHLTAADVDSMLDFHDRQMTEYRKALDDPSTRKILESMGVNPDEVAKHADREIAAVRKTKKVRKK